MGRPSKNNMPVQLHRPKVSHPYPGLLTNASELHTAAYEGNMSELHSLLGSRADPNAKNDYHESAPLHMARNAAVVQALLAAGASVGAENKNKMTPLHCAQTAEVARALLNGGANPAQLNFAGENSLDYAKKKNNAEVVQLLESWGWSKPSSCTLPARY